MKPQRVGRCRGGIAHAISDTFHQVSPVVLYQLSTGASHLRARYEFCVCTLSCSQFLYFKKQFCGRAFIIYAAQSVSDYRQGPGASIIGRANNRRR